MFFFDDSSDGEEKSLTLPQIPDSLINRTQMDMIDIPLPQTITQEIGAISTLNEPVINETSIAQDQSRTSSEDLTKLQMKRMKSKLRSKRSRDRKKVYLGQLENKVKELEKENMRLNTLLKNYQRSQNLGKNINKNCCTKIEAKREKFLKKFIDPITGQYNENTTSKLPDHFRKKSRKMIEGHQKSFTSSFETLLENIYPTFVVPYWNDLSTDCVKDYEILRRYCKLTKYQKPEYLEENKLNQVDIFLASLNPDKRQYNFMKNNFFAKENEIKESVLSAVKLLCQGKEILAQKACELYASKCMLMKSGIFSDKQFINSEFSSIDGRMATNFQKWKWGVTKKEITYTHNLIKDEHLSKGAKKFLTKSDYEVSLTTEIFTF